MITINPYKDVWVTIKSNYYKVSLANFIGAGTYAAPGVIECEENGNITPQEIEDAISDNNKRLQKP